MCNWVSIPFFSRYEVSDTGLIRSKTQTRKTKSGWRTFTGRMLKPAVKKGGYLHINLIDDNNEVKTRTIHSIVMLAFEGERPYGFQILHLDDTPANCAKSNLKYGTVRENHDFKVKHGRTARGEKINTSKLNEKLVVEIRERRAKGEKVNTLAKDYGVTTVAISKICLGENWKYAGGPIVENRFPNRRVKK